MESTNKKSYLVSNPRGIIGLEEFEDCQYLRTFKKWTERASDSQGDCSKFSANTEESKKFWGNVK